MTITNRSVVFCYRRLVKSIKHSVRGRFYQGRHQAGAEGAAAPPDTFAFLLKPFLKFNTDVDCERFCISARCLKKKTHSPSLAVICCFFLCLIVFYFYFIL